MIEMYIVYVPFWHVPLKYCFPPSKYGQFLLFFIGKTHLPTTQGTYGMAPVLLSCFFFWFIWFMAIVGSEDTSKTTKSTLSAPSS